MEQNCILFKCKCDIKKNFCPPPPILKPFLRPCLHHKVCAYITPFYFEGHLSKIHPGDKRKQFHHLERRHCSENTAELCKEVCP